MGFDVASVGAFLGGANQGVGQGMDLYAKYDEMKTKNEARQKQRSMEQKIAELAPLFKTDPVEATKQAGAYAAEQGDFDMYKKYTDVAEATRKADAQKTGMMGYVASINNPQSAADYMNQYYQKMGMANRVQYVRNQDNSFTMLGMGDDPKIGKRYDSAQDFHHDYMLALAPTMLGPEKFMDYETERGLKEAQTGQAQATTDYTRTRQTSEELGQPFIAGKAQAEIGSLQANAAQGYASAGLARTQAGRIGALLPGEVEGQVLTNQGKAADAAVAQGTIGSRISGAVTEANAARRKEMEAVDTTPERRRALQAELAKSEADAARAGTVAAYAGPEAEASLKATEANIRQSDAAATAAGQNRRAEDVQKAVKSFTSKTSAQELDIDYVPPLEADPAPMTEITSAIVDETKTNANAAASTAHEILANIKGVVGVDLRNGVIHMYDGSTRNVGVMAAQRIDRLRQQYSRKNSGSGAAAAGIGK